MSLRRQFLYLIVACASCVATTAMASDLRAELEAENARWLKAFNSPNPDAFPAMYAKDAILLPDGEKPVTGGPGEIKAYWEKNIKAGYKDHTFTIVTAHGEGKTAYMVSSWTVKGPDDKGAVVTYSGNTVRILERQADGSWQTKIHMFSSDK